MPQSQRTCCALSAASGACRCRWCGAALQFGRCPTPLERDETSLQARRLAAITRLLAPNSSTTVDEHVLAAIGALSPSGRAFHAAELCALAKRSPIAVRWSLERLASRGAVRRAGRTLVHASRWRQLWALADPPMRARGAAAPSRTKATANDAARAKGAGGSAGPRPRSDALLITPC